jgi:DNA-binding transcriptional LysR family regulator
MDLRALEHFVAVVDHGSITRAALAQHLTRPALSQHVRRLEAQLGVVLLRRTPAGVEPTPAGVELVAHARGLLAGERELRGAMDGHAAALRGLVRVAWTAGDDDGLADALAAFATAHPGVRLTASALRTAELDDALRRGAVDLAVRGGPADEPSPADVTTLREMPLGLLVASDDPLAADAAGVEVAALAGRPFVLAEEGSGRRAAALATCEAAGFGPLPRFVAGDPTAVERLVAAGLAVALVPAVPPATAGVVLRTVVPAPATFAVRLVRAAPVSPAAARLADWLVAALGGPA